MHFASYILPVLATFAPVNDAPAAVASRFLVYLEHGETAKASAMLTSDAMIGAGDVGGPLVVEAVPFAKMGCTLDSIADAAKPVSSDKPNIRVVDATWTCPYKDKPGTHAVKAIVLVDGEKVAALYIP